MRERQEIEPALSTPTPRTVRNAPSEMACPYAAVFRLSSPLVAHSAHAWPFAVATATQFRRFKRSRLAGIGAPSPPSGSDHSTATEEPAQSVTLPPTSPHAIVRCGDTPVLQSPGDRRERGKRKPRLGPMSASQPQRLHQSEPRDSQQARGVPGSTMAGRPRALFVTKRHKTSRFDHFC